jgi:adenylylsulfate kinase-like enzyme
MLERLSQTLENEMALASERPLYFWLIGPYASGKTTISQKLSKRLQTFGSVETYSDGNHFLKLVAEDKDHGLHDGQVNADGTRTVVIKSPKFDDLMRQRLVDEVSSFTGDVCLIEVGSGKDKLGIRI